MVEPRLIWEGTNERTGEKRASAIRRPENPRGVGRRAGRMGTSAAACYPHPKRADGRVEKCGVQKGKEYAILTDEITRAWSGMNTRQHKNLKGLRKENLRDDMSDLELALTMLAEASTTDIAKAEQPQGFDENQKVARRGGNVAGVARKALEAETGKPVVTAQNAESFRQLVTDIVTDAAQLPEQTEENTDGK